MRRRPARCTTPRPRARVGEIERPAGLVVADLHDRGKRGVRVLHRGARRPRRAPGRVRRATPLDQHWPDGVPEHTLRVIELQAVDADAEAALWSYLFGIDLVGDRAGGRPARRRPAALAPRRSPPAPRHRGARSPVGARRRRRRGARRPHLRRRRRPRDRARRRVPPREQRPVADRRWTRRRRRARAPTSTPTSRSSAPELGALYLGGVSRRRRSPRPGASRSGPTARSRRADRFFVAHPSPWCTTHF